MWTRQQAFTSRPERATGGTPFSLRALRGMLANRLYLGEIEHKGEVFAGRHEPLITQEVFERVRQILACNHHNLWVAPARATYAALLSGRRHREAEARGGRGEGAAGAPRARRG